ncbi:hypothetical protein B0H11DRAFT_1847743 [Mycena galericulata]|nr:hypothetical protein B0H11DRAFT_1847743 [Mycena galericulata]
MSAQTSESHTINHIYGGRGGDGGAGGERGGGGGAGEGSRFNYVVETESFTIHNHIQVQGPGLEQQQQMNLSEIRQSQAAATLVQCPPPSQIFQGRQDILEKMREYFANGIGEKHIYVLYGLGGSGKTQTALKFVDNANKPNLWFTKQFFINASSRQTLDTAFKDIAISQRIGKTSEDGLLWLTSEIEEWMLLFDNADDPSIDLFPFFPRCTHGNIIITSRNPQLAEHGPRSHSRVGDMDETSAIDLLLLRAVKEKTIETTQRASEIVKELSCLPLAIIQAGAYISKFNCLHKYLSIYRQNCTKLLRQHSTQSHDNYKWTVYTTWQISFEQLSTTAARFLQLCSLLHHDSIPEAIFEQAAAWMINDNGQEGHTLQEATGFLQKFLDTLSIHPLVHSWCQDTLDDEPIARECITDIIGMSVKLKEDDYLFRIGLMSHVDSLILDPTTIKSIFQKEYADIYFDSGRFKEAESLQAKMLEKQKQLLGTDHPDTLTAMANLALTYHQRGRYQEAEPLEDIVLEKRKQVLGPDHSDTLSAMASLAATYRQLGRYQEAEPFDGIVLEKRKQLLGADHPDTLSAMANLAATYHQLGRYQEAEPLEGIVLEKRKQLLGIYHPQTLLVMATLAATYRQLGRYQEAEPLESIVLEKRKQVLGADHPDTLSSMVNLAATYLQLGRYQEAEPLQGIVLEKRKQVLGEGHPYTLSAMGNLALTYHKFGKYQEAELLQGIVLEKRKQLLGADHLHTVLAMGNLAATYRQLGRYQDAEPLEGIVLEKRKQILGADHPDTLSAMANLALTYHQLGRYQEAEPLGAIVLEKRKQVLGADHPDTLSAMANLALTYHQLGRYQEAEPLEGIVLEKRKQVLGADHPDTLSAIGHLAATYRELERYQEAEPQDPFCRPCFVC